MWCVLSDQRHTKLLYSSFLINWDNLGLSNCPKSETAVMKWKSCDWHKELLCMYAIIIGCHEYLLYKYIYYYMRVLTHMGRSPSTTVLPINSNSGNKKDTHLCASSPLYCSRYGLVTGDHKLVLSAMYVHVVTTWSSLVLFLRLFLLDNEPSCAVD